MLVVPPAPPPAGPLEGGAVDVGTEGARVGCDRDTDFALEQPARQTIPTRAARAVRPARRGARGPRGWRGAFTSGVFRTLHRGAQTLHALGPGIFARGPTSSPDGSCLRSAKP